MYRRTNGNKSRFSVGRIAIALVIAVVSIISYYASSEFNPITEETQQVALSRSQEIAMGLQAVPEMTQMYGGLYADESLEGYLDEVCLRLVNYSEVSQTDWLFECHLLADDEMINAFALPGGQLFITYALFDRLETEGQLAGVMAHEIGHVVARHAAEQLAEQQLAQGISGAVVFATYDPDNPNGGLTTQQMTALISNLVTLKYGRGDELQSDELGVQFMSEAGYDPRALIGVMDILEAATQGNSPPEFFSTHPNPDNRRDEIMKAINELYPNGVPSDLES